MKVISMKSKLTLSRETLRSLTEPEIAVVAGGATIPIPDNLSKYYSCVYSWCGYSCACPKILP